MKILIIEDDAVIREEVTDWLRFEGYEVLSADNGRAGLRQALAAPPDVIVSDIAMPEMDGYAVLTALQQHPQMAAIPFIFLTARADKAFMRHGMALGADDYLTKPFTRAELLSAIHARVARHTALTAGVRQEIDALKSHLARRVSAALNTPLASLVFVRGIIERQMGQADEAQLADLLATLRAGTDQLEHLVRGMTYQTQIESGELSAAQLQSTARPLPLWQLLPPVIDQARRYARHHPDAPIDRRDCPMEAVVWGSLEPLKYALAEMVAGALDAAGTGAGLVLRCRVAGAQVQFYLGAVTAPDGPPATPPPDDFVPGWQTACRLLLLHGGRLPAALARGITLPIHLALPAQRPSLPVETGEKQP
ncbi:MAG: response regulator transcription factor [Anaerolineae bacterium]|nr:response regulator transcription factor [Anaerolineae bacterium]